jgi:hypothetical protein
MNSFKQSLTCEKKITGLKQVQAGAREKITNQNYAWRRKRREATKVPKPPINIAQVVGSGVAIN